MKYSIALILFRFTFAVTIKVEPYLQDANPHNIIIMWETDLNDQSIVNYGPDENLSNMAIGTSQISSGLARIHTVNINEGNDGFDTVEWIASQSWSNGKVGMTGSSHGGIVQTVASLTKPPHLTTIWVDVAPTNIFLHEAREGGCMSLWMFAALFLHAHDAPEIKSDLFAQQLIIDGWKDIKGLLKTIPFKEGITPLRVVPNLEETLLNYL